MRRLELVKPNSASSRLCRGGFTLLEVSLSLVIVSVIMIAIGSSILLASKAIPSSDSPPQCTNRAASEAEYMSSELKYALTVTQRTANSITFTVPDRSGDGLAEEIRYAWSGTPGDSILRWYNGGDAAAVLEDVHSFEMLYDIETISQQVTSKIKSFQTILRGFNNIEVFSNYPIRDDRWVGQYFKPNLPASAVSWSITKVATYVAASGSATGVSNVQIRSATPGGFPGMNVLDEVTLYENTLSPSVYTFREFIFDSATDIPADQGAALVIAHVSGDESCQVPVRVSWSGSPNMHYVETDNYGITWDAMDDRSMIFTVYGTYKIEGPPVTQTNYFLQHISVKAQVGVAPASAVHTATDIVNTPEVPAP